jgi:hypothetical protein
MSNSSFVFAGTTFTASGGVVTFYRGTNVKSALSFREDGVSLMGAALVSSANGLWASTDPQCAYFYAIANVPVVETRVLLSFGLPLPIVKDFLTGNPPLAEWYPDEVSMEFLPQSFGILDAAKSEVHVAFLE